MGVQISLLRNTIHLDKFLHYFHQGLELILVLATLVRDCGGVLAYATVDDMIKAVGDEVIFSEISSYLCSS